MRKIENNAHLDLLLSEHRAVVFLSVDWAMHARHSARVAQRLIERWNREQTDAPLVLSMINLTEQTGEMWDSVADWLAAQDIHDSNALMYGGVGPIIWLQSGRIVQYVTDASAETDDALIDRMVQAFADNQTENAT